MGLGDVAPGLGLQLSVNGLGAPFDRQPAGQNAFLRQPTIQTAVHRLSDRGDARAQIAGLTQLFLVGPFHLRDAQARGRAHLQHLGGAGKRVRHAGIGRFHRLVPRQLVSGDDKAAADGIVRLFQGEMPRGIKGAQHHSIGMAGQSGPVVKDQVLVGPVAQGRQTVRRH